MAFLQWSSGVVSLLLCFQHIPLRAYAQDVSCDPGTNNVDCGDPLNIAINGQIEFAGQLHQECSTIQASCESGALDEASCVQQSCKAGCVGNNPCCNVSPLTFACFNKGNGGSAIPSVSAASSTAPALPEACSTAQYFYSYCSSATPSFASLAPSAQASCLCYSSTAWSPNGLDIPYSSCVAYFNSAVPTATSDLMALSSRMGFCASMGNVLQAQITVGGAPAQVSAQTSTGTGSATSTGTRTASLTGTGDSTPKGSGTSTSTGIGISSSTGTGISTSRGVGTSIASATPATAIKSAGAGARERLVSFKAAGKVLTVICLLALLS